jgi:predicted nucleic acid-binding protein
MPHLLDSNIIIYASQPEHGDLRRFIAEQAPAVSAVSYVEVLGYHGLSDAERQHFKAFFSAATVLPLSQPVLDEAVRLQQHRRMALGDSLVAATCLVHALTLVTRNTSDFTWITDLPLLNPFELEDAGD